MEEAKGLRGQVYKGLRGHKGLRGQVYILHYIL